MPRALLYILVLLVVVGAGVGAYFALRPDPPQSTLAPQSAPGDPPGPSAPAPANAQSKLVVLVVFDQMRGDYMSRWAELYGPDGFERMKKDGIWFSECYVPYACTSTGPGHASLATGAPPSVHGIVENEWFDRKLGARVYCCQPSRPYELVPPVPPELGKPSRGSGIGYSPERLLAQTVGEALQEATKGKGRVFSMSLKDRTAVLMGGQKPNAAYCFDTRDGKFHTGAFYDRPAAHTWVTEFNAASPADAWFNTLWEKLRSDIEYDKYTGPDDVVYESPGVNGQGRTFPHPFKGKLEKPAKAYYDAVELSPAGNELLLALVKKCVTAEQLGRGEAPDLLCVSFSSNDMVGHFYGPDSQEVLDITLRADKLVGALLTFLDTEVGKGRYTLVLSADHGACPLPELPSTKAKYPFAARVLTSPQNEMLADLEAALTAMYGATDPPTRWLKARDADANEVWPWVYLDYDQIAARKLKVEDVASAVREWFVGRGYVETAFTRKELEDGTFPPDQPFKRAAVLAHRPDRCGDVLVVPKPGVLITPYKSGTSHGTPHSYDAHIPFLVYGAGVPALGQRREPVSSLMVAPTLAWALGVAAPKHAAVLPPEALPAAK